MSIAFFDSGIGGLTVLREAARRLPDEDFLFFADTLHVPYGPKTKEQVTEYVCEAAERIFGENVKALVIACNTATSVAVSDLRHAYRVPVIGMEPAVKPAVEMNGASGRRVLVLATQLTLSQTKYMQLVSRVDDHGIVDSLPMPELVDYCEGLNFDPEEVGGYFRRKFEPFDLNEYGTIVLGCTHYPYYTRMLEDILPPHIRVIDGSAGTVRRVSAILGERGIEGGGSGRVRFMNSADDPAYNRKLERAWAILNDEKRPNGAR
ncbi:glutamate racemase [Saccharibacillus alkalitolerans]|uniref:Glutamate racemase n=1 Tax=Saccharibacillus alkalitolerans TaxID=2705290 RepID=A0ABX0F874_9BACL|nr:glutamate racemase [Saccharibacillus alkalitolerans]NGZ77167.1 glutamate racemase [Saccharibacillus alkalitolerans]